MYIRVATLTLRLHDVVGRSLDHIRYVQFPIGLRALSELTLSMGACLSNLKFVSLVILELLAFNAQKFKGSRDPSHYLCSKIFFREHLVTYRGSMHANLKFVSLDIFELLAFNAHNLRGHVTHAPLSKKI